MPKVRDITDQEHAALLAILPSDLPAPVALELITSCGESAVIMFALHNPQCRARIISLIDQKLHQHEITDVTGRGLIALLEATVVMAIQGTS